MIIKIRRFRGCVITLNEMNYINIKTKISEQGIPFKDEIEALEYFKIKSQKISAEQKKAY